MGPSPALAERHGRIDGQPQGVGHPLFEKETQNTRAALDEKLPDAAFLQLGDDGAGTRRIAAYDGGDAVQFGEPGGREDVMFGVALCEESQGRIELSGSGDRHLGQVGAQSALGTPAPCFRIAQQQGRIVATQGLGTHQNGVVLGTQAVDFGHIFGSRDRQPLGGVVVHVAVGRDRGGEVYEHRRNVIRVTSGRAPMRIG